MDHMDDNELMLPKKLAERMKVSVSLVRKLMREGEIEFIEYSPKVRKIRLSSWHAYERRKTRKTRED